MGCRCAGTGKRHDLGSNDVLGRFVVGVIENESYVETEKVW